MTKKPVHKSANQYYRLSSIRRPTCFRPPSSLGCQVRWSGHYTFQMPSKLNVEIDACAPFDAVHAKHNLLIDA